MPEGGLSDAEFLKRLSRDRGEWDGGADLVEHEGSAGGDSLKSGIFIVSGWGSHCHIFPRFAYRVILGMLAS